MPRRSKGCVKCVQRKVRCDETKPQCQRCHDYGVECPGYRAEAGTERTFVDQTDLISRKLGSRLVAQTVVITPEEKNEKEYRWRQRHQNVLSKTEPVQSISNRHVTRMQTLGSFMEIYFPKQSNLESMSHFSYLQMLPQIDLSSTFIQLTVDALCFVELGSLRNDQRLLHEARDRYIKALPMLAKQLSRRPAQQDNPEGLLTTIALMTLCELFDGIARGSSGGQGWFFHVHGAQQFLIAHGPGIIKSAMGELVFHNIRHTSVCMGLTQRKTILFARPEWMRLTANPSKPDPWIALYDLAVQIPGLLERADTLASSPKPSPDFPTLCTEICRLREAFDHWLDRFYSHYYIPQYSVVDIRSMPTFIHLCHDRTFLTVFSFPTVEICSQHQLSWVLSLLLDFTLANLYRVFRDRDPALPPLHTFTPRTPVDLWRDMYVNATNYCRCVPFCCEPNTSSTGRLGTFLMRIAQNFFEIGDFPDELAWCHAVREIIESGLAQHSSRPGGAHAASPPITPPALPSSSTSPPSSSLGTSICRITGLHRQPFTSCYLIDTSPPPTPRNPWMIVPVVLPPSTDAHEPDPKQNQTMCGEVHDNLTPFASLGLVNPMVKLSLPPMQALRGLTLEEKVAVWFGG